MLWHRYKWQSRLAILGHRTARLRNDPGLTNLTVEVYAGRQIMKLFSLTESDINDYEKHVKIIHKG